MYSGDKYLGLMVKLCFYPDEDYDKQQQQHQAHRDCPSAGHHPPSSTTGNPDRFEATYSKAGKPVPIYRLTAGWIRKSKLKSCSILVINVQDLCLAGQLNHIFVYMKTKKSRSKTKELSAAIVPQPDSNNRCLHHLDRLAATLFNSRQACVN